MFKDYYACRAWLEGFIPQTYTRKELGLERISYFLKLLGNPQEKFKSIHIAGTSGKGSTAFYLARALTISNFKFQISNRKAIKVGLHVSPHLVYIGERMQINGRVIGLGRFIRLIGELQPVVEAMSGSKVGAPSYFEILVAASFLYFAQEKVDIAVVEVGLGGRLDATNVLTPEVSVITNIGLDHTEILGKTIEAIAKEKAGIIKGVIRLSGNQVIGKKIGVPVVTGAGGKALEVIKNVAKEKNAPLITESTLQREDREYYDMLRNVKEQIDRVNGNKFWVTSECLFLVNLALAELGIRLTDADQLKTFTANFEGRFEEIDRGIIIDGAHNRDKVRVLINWVQKRQQETGNTKQETKIVLVCAFKKGKDWKGMLRLLIKELDIERVYATQFYSVTDTGKFSAVEPEEIKEFLISNLKFQISKIGIFDNSQETVWEAVNRKQETGNKKQILVTGSLYLAGEARTLWKSPEF